LQGEEKEKDLVAGKGGKKGREKNNTLRDYSSHRKNTKEEKGGRRGPKGPNASILKGGESNYIILSPTTYTERGRRKKEGCPPVWGEGGKKRE